MGTYPTLIALRASAMHQENTAMTTLPRNKKKYIHLSFPTGGSPLKSKAMLSSSQHLAKCPEQSRADGALRESKDSNVRANKPNPRLPILGLVYVLEDDQSFSL